MRILCVDRDAVGIDDDIEDARVRADGGTQHRERKRKLAVVIEKICRGAAAGGEERHARRHRANA